MDVAAEVLSEASAAALAMAAKAETTGSSPPPPPAEKVPRPPLSTAKLLRRLCIPGAAEPGGAEEGAADATRPCLKETWARGLRMRAAQPAGSLTTLAMALTAQLKDAREKEARIEPCPSSPPALPPAAAAAPAAPAAPAAVPSLAAAAVAACACASAGSSCSSSSSSGYPAYLYSASCCQKRAVGREPLAESR